MSDAITAVVTVFQLIEAMAAHQRPIGVSELARAVGMPRARTHRHLRTLVDIGYAAQEAAGERYLLTPRLFHLGQSVAGQIDLLGAARAVMPGLLARVGLAVSIGQIEARGVRVLDIMRPQSAIEISTSPGALFAFRGSAQGKVAMAFAPECRAAVLAEGPLDATLEADLETELEAVRRQGWALSAQEVLAGINALAAPVFDAEGRLAGTIALVGLIQSLPRDPDPDVIEALLHAARQISEQLGYREGETNP